VDIPFRWDVHLGGLTVMKVQGVLFTDIPELCLDFPELYFPVLDSLITHAHNTLQKVGQVCNKWKLFSRAVGATMDQEP